MFESVTAALVSASGMAVPTAKVRRGSKVSMVRVRWRCIVVVRMAIRLEDVR